LPRKALERRLIDGAGRGPATKGAQPMTSRPSKRAGRVFKAISSLVLGVMAVFALLLVLLGIFARPGSDGISRIANHPILKVLSGSMTGVFSPGDMIIDNPITTAQSQRLVAGDIITFHVANTSSNNLITHRIVAVNRADGQLTYQTKGDANNAPDPEPVAPTQIVGTYRQHVPYAGYLLQWAQQKTIFFLLIVVPLVYLVVLEIAKHWNEPPKKDDGAPASDDVVVTGSDGFGVGGADADAETEFEYATGQQAALSLVGSEERWTAEPRQGPQHASGAGTRRRSGGGRRRA
jgi:signal peptidase